jgi:hypothetical protein
MNFEIAFIVIFAVIIPILFQIVKLSITTQKNFNIIIQKLESINKRMIQ